MPGIVTHYVFGTEVYRRISEVIGEGDDVREAFLLGNLGPDPFFYLQVVIPKGNPLRRIASTMHRDDTDTLLDCVHRTMVSGSGRDEMVSAYGIGFLCHYLLDSAVHPLVYAQQYAICESEEGWLEDAWMPRVVHSTIETEYDEYVLSTKLSATVSSLPPHRVMLRCPGRPLAAISVTMAEVVRTVYRAKAPMCLFQVAVGLFRMAQVALDSKSTGLRRRIDYLQPLGLSTAYTNALAHRDERRMSTPFANADHVAWPHPFVPGAVVAEDFDSLYAFAFEKALATIPDYLQDSFVLDDCRALTGGLNFQGRNTRDCDAVRAPSV